MVRAGDLEHQDSVDGPPGTGRWGRPRDGGRAAKTLADLLKTPSSPGPLAAAGGAAPSSPSPSISSSSPLPRVASTESVSSDESAAASQSLPESIATLAHAEVKRLLTLRGAAAAASQGGAGGAGGRAASPPRRRLPVFEAIVASPEPLTTTSTATTGQTHNNDGGDAWTAELIFAPPSGGTPETPERCRCACTGVVPLPSLSRTRQVRAASREKVLFSEDSVYQLYHGPVGLASGYALRHELQRSPIFDRLAADLGALAPGLSLATAESKQSGIYCWHTASGKAQCVSIDVAGLVPNTVVSLFFKAGN